MVAEAYLTLARMLGILSTNYRAFTGLTQRPICTQTLTMLYQNIKINIKINKNSPAINLI